IVHLPIYEERSKFDRCVEANNSRIQRKDVGRQAGIVGVDEKARDGRLVEEILDVELKRQFRLRVRQCERKIDIVPCPQPSDWRVINATEAFGLAGIAAAEGQFPVTVFEKESILCSDVRGETRRVGQFVASQVRVESAPAIRCTAAALVDRQAYG